MGDEWTTPLYAARERAAQADRRKAEQEQKERAETEIRERYLGEAFALHREFVAKAKTCPRSHWTTVYGVPTRMWMISTWEGQAMNGAPGVGGNFLDSKGRYWRGSSGTHESSSGYVSRGKLERSAPTVPYLRSDKDSLEAYVVELVDFERSRLAAVLVEYGYTGA